LDKGLSWLIVSPNMHKVHHHYMQPYTDSNYGNIFSFWDRVFGTFKHLQPKQIVYGIDTHMGVEENSKIGNLLQIPFQPYRKPGGKL
ncbi:MAG TPA: sterol desaturase family protein, partial [Chitinophagales bacterium]|nr:sterol desaturase family protein [Chitinophagales bacterium]